MSKNYESATVEIMRLQCNFNVMQLFKGLVIEKF